MSDPDGSSRTAEGPGGSAAETFEVSGSVWYRQRVDLPTGAFVTVRLSDVSVADAPSTTVAEQVIEPDHQPPIPYALTVDRSALHDRRTYSVSARITGDDELVWISDTHIPVTASGPAAGIDLLVVPVSR